MDSINKVYYVYAWYFKDSGDIFYIGKGKGNRYRETHAHRNRFFKNTLNKHGDNVDVKILVDGLYEKDALDLERKLISEYKSVGQCKTNLHEGGCGGNTGNYINPERSRKLSEAAKTRIGPKNPNYGHKMSDELKEKLRRINTGKKISEKSRLTLIKANTGRKKTPEEIEKLRIANLGKVRPENYVREMIKRECEFYYKLSYKGKDFIICYGQNSLIKFCKTKLRISRSIVPKICDGLFKPKFNRHKWIKDLIITKIEKTSIDDYIFDIKSKTYVLDERTLDEVISDKDKSLKMANIIRYGVETKYYR